MSSNAVGWFEIYVQDMERAKAFYEGVFGTPLAPLESPGIEMLAFPMDSERYGSPGALVKMPGFPFRWKQRAGLLHLRRLRS